MHRSLLRCASALTRCAPVITEVTRQWCRHVCNLIRAKRTCLDNLCTLTYTTLARDEAHIPAILMWRVVNFLVGIGWHKVLCTFDPEIFKGRFAVELDKERWFAHQAAWRAYVIARLHFVADKDLFRYDEQIKERQFFLCLLSPDAKNFYPKAAGGRYQQQQEWRNSNNAILLSFFPNTQLCHHVHDVYLICLNLRECFKIFTTDSRRGRLSENIDSPHRSCRGENGHEPIFRFNMQ